MSSCTLRQRRKKKSAKRELISRAELARRKGCSRSAATQACQSRLAGAVVGRHVDAAHETVRQWLAETDGTRTESYADLMLRKRRAEVQRLELGNNQTAGMLISRDLVKTHLFSAIEASNRRLLTDAPKTIVRRVYALARSGAAIEEAERVIREIVSSHLKFVSVTATRVLRRGQRPSITKPDDDESDGGAPAVA
jgi:hypothetical protein